MAIESVGYTEGSGKDIAVDTISAVEYQVVRISLGPDGTHSALLDKWTPSLQADETANDSDKEFTVSASTEWWLQWIWVEYTSTATAGDRQLEVLVKDDADDTIMQFQPGIVQAESNTYYYLLAPGMPDLLGLRDTSYLLTPLPPTIILPASYDVRVYDNNAVDAAADDMVVQMMVLERAA